MTELKGGHQCSAPVDKRYIPALRSEVSVKIVSRNAPRSSTCRAAAQYTTAQLPKRTATPTRLSLAEAKRIATTAGARDISIVASHLVLCASASDAEHSIAELRRNRPEYFVTRRVEQGSRAPCRRRQS